MWPAAHREGDEIGFQFRACCELLGHDADRCCGIGATEQTLHLALQDCVLARQPQQPHAQLLDLGLSVQHVVLHRLTDVVPRTGDRGELLEFGAGTQDDSLRLGVEREFLEGEPHITHHAIDGLLNRPVDTLRVGRGDRAAQIALARKRQLLPEPEHLHRHLLSPQTERRERSIDDADLEHRVLERARRAHPLACRLELAAGGCDFRVVGQRLADECGKLRWARGRVVDRVGVGSAERQRDT